jgi:hypothetical protein
LLPLPEGSRLVVDASDAVVKAGQTDPRELRRLVARGVRVYCRPNLHAKVFVLDGVAFVGSTNVSRRSRDTLLEALIETSARAVVKAARDFVMKNCLDDLGPEELNRLARLYREPKNLDGGRRRGQGRRAQVRSAIPRVMLAQLTSDDPPEGSEATCEAGLKAAKRLMSRRRLHHVDDFWWPGACPFRKGDIVVQVVEEDRGAVMVSPPGRVIGLRESRRGSRRTTFVYLELPRQRRISFDRLAQLLGRGARKRLQRRGRVGRDFAEPLLSHFGMQAVDPAW